MKTISFIFIVLGIIFAGVTTWLIFSIYWIHNVDQGFISNLLRTIHNFVSSSDDIKFGIAIGYIQAVGQMLLLFGLGRLLINKNK